MIDLTPPHVRRFCTIFRRECLRTGAATRFVVEGGTLGATPTLEQAAYASVDGYDDWAAAAYAASKLHLSPPSQAALACAMSRSPMSEVVFTEIRLSAGEMPYQNHDEYDWRASRFRHVRSWPRQRGVRLGPLHKLMEAFRIPRTKMASSKNLVDPVGLLLVDHPWLIPQDVVDDPAYRGAIPEASMVKTELDFDVPGLWKRLDREMLVVEAVFDPKAAEKLEAE